MKWLLLFFTLPLLATDSRPVGLTTSIDWLIWQFREDNLGYTFSGFDESTSEPITGNVHQLPNRWQSGFRLGLGTIISPDMWDLTMSYTYYRNSEADTYVADDLYPLWNIGNNFTTYTNGDIFSAGAGIDFALNTIDFVLGKTWYTSRFFEVYPFVGLKAAWNSQDYTVKYGHQFSTSFAELLEMNNNQEFRGIGPRFGTKLTCTFDEMMSIFSNFATSIVGGWYVVTRKDQETLIPIDLSSPLVRTNTRYSYLRAAYVLETSLGLQYRFFFDDKRMRLDLSGAWELQYWMNQNQLINLSSHQVNGDIALNGCTIRALFAF